MTSDQQMAIYRRDHKRRLRQIKARALETLGLGPHDPMIELIWDSQLNSRAALCMLDLLRRLQTELPEHHDRIEQTLAELGIPATDSEECMFCHKRQASGHMAYIANLHGVVCADCLAERITQR